MKILASDRDNLFLTVLVHPCKKVETRQVGERSRTARLYSIIRSLVTIENWYYNLANALSRRDVPREPDMMIVLKNLIERGLVKRYVEKGSPHDRS